MTNRTGLEYWKARSAKLEDLVEKVALENTALVACAEDLTGRLKTAISEAKMLEARAETAEASVKELRAYNERLSGLVDKWHRDAEFNGTACDEQKKRADAAEKRVKELEEALAEAIGRYRRQAAALEAKP